LATNNLFKLIFSEEKLQNYLNEVKQAGTYSVTFNALHLSSGVYFYSITAGYFRQVKKMILAK
jgi:uncharacterized protein YdaL